MLGILATAHCLRRNAIHTTVLNYKRCAHLKPIAPYLRAVTACNDPCAGSSGGANRITYVPYKAPPPKQHDYKNMALGRPMSPHLTIYAPTLPAMTSIVQRATGMILVFYAVMLAGGSLFLSNGIETYVSMIQSLNLGRISILIIKLILGAPFAFHYFNGIRFCMWNLGKWLPIKEVYSSAKKCFVLTAVVTVLFAML